MSLLHNVATWKPTIVVKKEALAQVFLCEFSEILRNTYFVENLRKTAPDFLKKYFNAILQGK